MQTVGAAAAEVDEIKRRLNSKIQELTLQLEAAVAKASSSDKAKIRLQADLDDAMLEVEKVGSLHNIPSSFAFNFLST